MAITLNRTTFRRLVQLYLLSIVIAVAAYALEYVIWQRFADAADRLTTEHFGEASDIQLFSLGGLMFAAFVAHVVAIFGLFAFKRWSRGLSWLSLVVMLPGGFLPFLTISWTGFWTAWIEMIGAALFGAILTLAYSRDHGAIWFGEPSREANL